MIDNWMLMVESDMLDSDGDYSGVSDDEDFEKKGATINYYRVYVEGTASFVRYIRAENEDQALDLVVDQLYKFCVEDLNICDFDVKEDEGDE